MLSCVYHVVVAIVSRSFFVNWNIAARVVHLLGLPTVVLVKKKNGSIRFCVDYRALNHLTVKIVYPLPRVDNVLDRLRGARYVSTLDLYKGYWQVPLHDADRSKTAFVTPVGLFNLKDGVWSVQCAGVVPAHDGHSFGRA